MKKILLFILVLFGISITYPQDIDNHDQSNKAVLRYLISDSLLQILEDKSFLIYSYGHHGHNWCLIYQWEKSYKIIIGSTRIKQPDLTSNIDTLKLLDSYQSLICWGMDSLPQMVKTMKPLYPKEWTPFYSTLNVYISGPECIFASNNASGFSGEGENEVNKKYAELCYLMLWLSEPSARKFLPGFEQFENRESILNKDNTSINQ